MYGEEKNLREELRAYRLEFDLIQKIPCSKRENTEYKKMLKESGTLPEGVYAYIYNNGTESKDEFYTLCETDLTEDEIAEYLTFKKLSLLKTIKTCAVFFTVLSVLGVAACVILLLLSL